MRELIERLRNERIEEESDSVVMRKFTNVLGRKSHYGFMHRGDHILNKSMHKIAKVTPSGGNFDVSVVGGKSHSGISQDKAVEIVDDALKQSFKKTGLE